jgi:hypothetical protein
MISKWYHGIKNLGVFRSDDMGIWGYFLKYEEARYAPIKAKIATSIFSICSFL